MRAGGEKAIFISSATYLSNTSANAASFKSINTKMLLPLTSIWVSAALLPLHRYSWSAAVAKPQMKPSDLSTALSKQVTVFTPSVNAKSYPGAGQQSTLWNPVASAPTHWPCPQGQPQGMVWKGFTSCTTKEGQGGTTNISPHLVTKKPEEELPLPLQSHICNEAIGNKGTV